MSQFDFGTIDPNSKSGPQLALDLNNFRDALNSCHRGSVRPTYAQGGTLWLKEVSSTQWDLVLYDGDTDLTIRSINPTTNTLIGIPATQISGLGTAATATLTTNTSDSTIGRVLRVGDFGNGTTDGVSAADANSIAATGVYVLSASGSGGLNGPTQVPNVPYLILHTSRSSGSSFQLASPATSTAADKTRLFLRQSFGGAWSAWVEVFTSGNVSAFSQTLLDDADAPAARATLGAAPSGLAAKLVINFNGQATPPTITSQVGTVQVTSVTRSATGVYDLNLSSAIVSNIQNLVAPGMRMRISGGVYVGVFDVSASTTTTLRITLADSAGTAANSSLISYAFFSAEG